MSIIKGASGLEKEIESSKTFRENAEANPVKFLAATTAALAMFIAGYSPAVASPAKKKSENIVVADASGTHSSYSFQSEDFTGPDNDEDMDDPDGYATDFDQGICGPGRTTCDMRTHILNVVQGLESAYDLFEFEDAVIYRKDGELYLHGSYLLFKTPGVTEGRAQDHRKTKKVHMPDGTVKTYKTDVHRKHDWKAHDYSGVFNVIQMITGLPMSYDNKVRVVSANVHAGEGTFDPDRFTEVVERRAAGPGEPDDLSTVVGGGPIDRDFLYKCSSLPCIGTNGKPIAHLSNKGRQIKGVGYHPEIDVCDKDLIIRNVETGEMMHYNGAHLIIPLDAIPMPLYVLGNGDGKGHVDRHDHGDDDDDNGDRDRDRPGDDDVPGRNGDDHSGNGGDNGNGGNTSHVSDGCPVKKVTYNIYNCPGGKPKQGRDKGRDGNGRQPPKGDGTQGTQKGNGHQGDDKVPVTVPDETPGVDDGSASQTPQTPKEQYKDLPRIVLSARATPYDTSLTPERFVLASLGLGVRVTNHLYLIPRIGYANGGSDTDHEDKYTSANPDDPFGLDFHGTIDTTNKAQILAPELELRVANHSGYFNLSAGAWRLKMSETKDYWEGIYMPDGPLVDEESWSDPAVKDISWLVTGGAGVGIFLLDNRLSIGASINGVRDEDDKYNFSGSIDLSGYF